MCILKIGRDRTILDEVFFKLRVSFDGLVSRKKVFLEYGHRFETHLDLVVEFTDVKKSASFDFCLDESS